MRLRFAPSPTGSLHIGNVKTAICNYIIAKKHNAELVLRIEDTDMERSTSESEKSILDDLRWIGIEWKEGPDVGGDFGPYRQSERLDIYKKYTERLIQDGNAYYCYCTQVELDEMRSKSNGKGRAFTYSGRCRNLTEDEIREYKSGGRKPSVRFRLPEEEIIVVDDIIKGRVVFDSRNIGGDFIIVRSDGIPVYNYIVVIDDALMKITHVIRGEDHLSNTPKQILIAKALDLPIPEYAHHGLILGPDRSKMSKRHGITSLETYRKEGYLPEALSNYLAMLGWASESGDEILSIDEIIKQISIEYLSKGPAIFDFQKLKWMNGYYIRDYPIKEITDLFIPYIKEAGYDPEGLDRGWLESVLTLLRSNCEILSDIQRYIGIFIEEIITPNEEASDLLNQEHSKKIIEEAYKIMNTSIDKDNFSKDLINRIKDNTSIKGKKLFLPIRAILTGRLKGPELDHSIDIIGFDKCKKRIEYIYSRYV